MTALVYGLQSAVLDVRVDLRRGDVGVAEKFLQSTNLGAACQHVSCETMPQGVRADSFAGAAAPGVLLHQVPDHDP